MRSSMTDETGKHHTRRCEFPFGEYVMDEAAVKPSIAILERVDVDKAEGGGRRMQHRVETAVAHAVVRSQHSAA